MAISDRIKAEARRTIDGIQKYYEKYGADVEDAEEMEHRIERVESAMAGCNGLSHDDKIQKTAENLFELTCAQERSFDAMRKEMKLIRKECKAEFEDIRLNCMQEFESLNEELRSGLKAVAQKIEDSGSDCSRPSNGSQKESNGSQKEMWMLAKVISEHPSMAFAAFIFILILVFVSGHFEAISKLFGG